MIEFYKVTKYYNKNTIKALDDISLKINKGEFLFLTGHSGSGKSTLLKLIFRGLIPNAGNVLVDNWNVGKLPISKIPYLRRKIGIVFQDFRLLYNKTVYDNISFVMQMMTSKRDIIKQKTKKILTEVGLWYKRNYFPHNLSGGEQQRIAIARALVNDPLIILADEPTGNLDAENAENVMSLLKHINFKGTTVLVASHNIEYIKSFKTRVISLKEGKILKDCLSTKL
jgi:cell division transport system ATP-binding protein